MKNQKYKIIMSSRFEKSYKKIKKQGKSLIKLDKIIKKLACGESLDEKNHDHQLHGDLSKYRECHIEPDWLLIYEIQKNKLLLYLFDTGSHSDLY